jgi:hypothetical protein
MMRYRPASRRPGRKRPSFSKYSTELDGREDDEGAGRAERCDGEGGAKSSVAKSSVLLTGVPHEEQKRPVLGSSEPQDMQEGMIFPDTVYRVGGSLVSWNISFARTRNAMKQVFAAVWGKMFPAI